MEKTPPTAYELALGTSLMAVSVGAALYVLFGPGEPTTSAWAFIGTLGAYGAYVVSPYRFTTFWREARRLIPWVRERTRERERREE